MPDMVRVSEVQERSFSGDGRHQTPATGDGKMDAAALAFETANELMDSVERTVSTHFVYDVVERLLIEEQDLRTQVNSPPVNLIAIADELCIETV